MMGKIEIEIVTGIRIRNESEIEDTVPDQENEGKDLDQEAEISVQDPEVVINIHHESVQDHHQEKRKLNLEGVKLLCTGMSLLLDLNTFLLCNIKQCKVSFKVFSLLQCHN